MRWSISAQHAGMPIRDFLLQELRFSSRLVKKAKSPAGRITVNGEHKTVRYVLQKGDRIEIILPPEEKGRAMAAEPMDLSICYEDDDLLVINKRAGMPVIPSGIYPNGTLANGLLHYYEKQSYPYTVHIVTRLDKDTSGLVLVAKHQYCHSLLASLQKQHEIKRKYIAIVHGKLSQKTGTIDKPIGRKSISIIEREVTETGKRAVTHYHVLKEFATYSIVEVELETGRTHQIRVHFSSIGHPLVGDDLYGGEKSSIKRQALHCVALQFVQPFSNQLVKITSEMPADMLHVIGG